MTVDIALDVGLAALLVGVAGWIVAARQSLAAVVGFVAYGLLLAVAWARLAAFDVALTEAAIGSGVTGALLLGAATRLRPTEAAMGMHWPHANLRWVTAGLCAAVSVGLAAVILNPPDPVPTLAPLAVATLPSTGLTNAVSSVLLVYRAVDTLLEVVVLVLALLGVWSLAPDRFWGGVPGLWQQGQSDNPLKMLVRLLAPVGVLVGIYIFWIGAIGPGGEFQGAAIIASMWILVMMAGLRAPPATGQFRLRLVLIAGPAVFLGVGMAGFFWAGGFLAYPDGYAKPLIVGIETVLMLSIAAILGLLAAGAPVRTLE